ncbi:MAG: oligosaccharide flippase family protein [Patescibacteria group bacterium]|nr:oligosaccharide flippase family protein [Patescibacteria group bacterium]
MISKFKYFTKISFVQDVSVLGIGNSFSIFLGAISSIILARLLHPELYGIYGLVFAFVGLVGIFMNWGGNSASLTLLAEAYAQKNKEEIKNILTYFIQITILAICIIGILSVIFAPFLTELFYHNSQIGHWARIILLASFITFIYNLLIIVLQITRKIKQLTILEIFNKLVYILLSIIFVLLGFGLNGIIWGYFISVFIFLILSFFLYLYFSKKDNLLPSLDQIFFNFRKIRFKKYFNFGFSIAIGKNLNSLISFLPIIFLGAFASVQEVGYFKIALGYITIPSMLLGPVSRLLAVQLPKSKSYNLKILKEHFYKTTLYSGLISILLVVPFIILAPYLIKLFYGAEYLPGIELVYYLAILTVFSGFSIGIGPFFRTFDKMKIIIITNICYVVLMVLLMSISVRIYNSLIAIILSMIICATIFLLLHFFIIMRVLKNTEKNN